MNYLGLTLRVVVEICEVLELTIRVVVENGESRPLTLEHVIQVGMRQRFVVRMHVDGEVIVVLVRVPLRLDVWDGHVITDRLHVTSGNT